MEFIYRQICEWILPHIFDKGIYNITHSQLLQKKTFIYNNNICIAEKSCKVLKNIFIRKRKLFNYFTQPYVGYLSKLYDFFFMMIFFK